MLRKLFIVLILQIVNKFMPYALAFIFVTVSIYQRVLFSFVCITFDKRVDKGPGPGGNDHYNRNFYGDDLSACNFDLLSCCFFQQKKVGRNSSIMAGR
jgi:hypothetical protein